MPCPFLRNEFEYFPEFERRVDLVNADFGDVSQELGCAAYWAHLRLHLSAHYGVTRRVWILRTQSREVEAGIDDKQAAVGILFSLKNPLQFSGLLFTLRGRAFDIAPDALKPSLVQRDRPIPEPAALLSKAQPVTIALLAYGFESRGREPQRFQLGFVEPGRGTSPPWNSE